MPIVLADGDILKVTIQSRLFNQTIMNVLHYKFLMLDSFGYNLEEASVDLKNRFATGAAAGNVIVRMNEVTVEEMKVEWLSVQRVGPSLSVAIHESINQDGSIGDSNAGAANIALTIQKHTNTPGRKGIGSFHLAGCTVEHLVDGLWTGATVAGALNLSTALRQTITMPANVAGYEPGLYNPRDVNPTWRPLTATTVHTTARVMRRRTVGVGI